MISGSLPQIATARILHSTSPWPGAGTGTRWTSNLPGDVRTSACIASGTTDFMVDLLFGDPPGATSHP